jgi:arylsulfatase A-like enzyme
MRRTATAILLILIAIGTAYASETNRPNVILIFADDLRYSGVHANGCDQVITPNLNQIAAQGIIFDQAYLMGSFTGATCVPSRAMLLTGRGLFDLRDKGHVIPEDHLTLGEAFSKAGYHSQIFGKWHQDNASLARSFNEGGKMMSRGIYLVDHYRMPYWDWKTDGNYRREDGYLLVYGDDGEVKQRPVTNEDKRGPTGTEYDGPHSSEVWTDEAVEFIRGYEKDRPFFMYLAYHAPHDPRQAPREFKDLYKPEELDLPPSFKSQHPFDNGDVLCRDELLAPFPRTPENTRQQLADYYAIISHMDFQIGRVVDELRSRGLLNNTIILFVGDSGLAVGNHGLFGKQNLYNEDGIHVPLFLSGRGLPAGRRSDALCYMYDIFPTLCDLAGIETPASVTGKSLLPVIRGASQDHRDYLYHTYLQYQRAYREGDYKLIEYVKAPSGKESEAYKGARVTQLYHIKKDPWETHNLAYYAENQDLLEMMRAGMKRAALEEEDKAHPATAPIKFWDYY